MQLFGDKLQVKRRVMTIFYAIACIHTMAVLGFIIYTLRFDADIPTASGWTRPALEQVLSHYLMTKAVDASAAQDWDTVSLHIARYLALCFYGDLTFDNEALSRCLNRIDLRPTAFMSGKYTQSFLEWFIMAPIKYWSAEALDPVEQTFILVESQSKERFVRITGRPFLLCYTILDVPDYRPVPIPMIIDAQILVGRIESNSFYFDKKVELPCDGSPVQYIWPPEYHDLDGDGHDEIWIRFNREAADGFMQCLAIYRDDLSLLAVFTGIAEGIARRLPDGRVQVGYGCEAEGQEEGHLGCSRIMLKTLEYRNDSFIKISEHRIPHILWTDAWLDFFDLK